MWTDIRIGPGICMSEQLLEMQLERSQTHLLDVKLFLHAKGCFCGTPLPRVLNLFQTVKSHVFRWRRLCLLIRDSNTSFGEIMLSLKSMGAPCLESFELEFRGFAEPIKFDLFAEGTPKLLSVTLRGLGMYIGYPQLHTVTCLELGPSIGNEPACYREIRASLKSMPLLNKLVVNGLYVGDIADPIIQVPSLRSLEIINTRHIPSGAIHPLSIFYTPSLESLSLDVQPGQRLLNVIENIQNRPTFQGFPHMGELELSIPCGISNDELLDLCNAFPATTRIHVLSPPVPHLFDVVMNILYILDPSDGRVRWPRLRTIAVLPLLHQFYFDILYMMISSRIAVGHPITRIKAPLSFLHEIPAGRLQWLRDRVELEID